MKNYLRAERFIVILSLFLSLYFVSLLSGLVSLRAKRSNLIVERLLRRFAPRNDTLLVSRKRSINDYGYHNLDMSDFVFNNNAIDQGILVHSESNRKMDGQKWDLLGKYLYNFGQENRWYNFYQALVDHDYFSDINYRVTPAAGLGYHIANTEDWIWDADAGLGYRSLLLPTH